MHLAPDVLKKKVSYWIAQGILREGSSKDSYVLADAPGELISGKRLWVYCTVLTVSRRDDKR